MPRIYLIISFLLCSACSPAFQEKNFPPILEQLHSPVPSEVYTEGHNLPLQVRVTDPDDIAKDLLIRWQSDLDGFIIEATPDSNGQLTVNTSNLSVGEHILTVMVQDQSGQFVEQDVDIRINALPSQPSIQLLPSNPSTADDLQLRILSAEDVDGDQLQPMIRWYQNGIVYPDADDLEQLSSAATNKDDVWSVVVSLSDGLGESPSTEASITIDNHPPTIETVTIEPPAEAYNDSILVCSATGTDLDQDELAYSYQWEVLTEGVVSTLTENTETIVLTPNLVNANSRLYCIATVSDGNDSVTASTYVEIANRPPNISEVLVLPSTDIRAATILECSATVIDTDQEDVELHYRWLNETTGTTLSTNASFALTTSHGSKGDKLICQATATDPHGASHTAENFLFISNTPPEITQTSLLPLQPTSQDTLNCLANATDIDATDTVSFLYTWTIDGVLQPETTASLSGPFSVGSAISCTVTPTDGEHVGTAAQLSTTVINSAPTIDSIQFDIHPIYTDSFITAEIVATDIDNDPITLTYDWYVNGVLLYHGPAPSLDGLVHYDKGDQLWVEVTPHDGTTQGATLVSDVQIVANAPPVAAVLTALDDFSYQEKDLGCEIATEASDPDGDPISYQFEWQQNGLPADPLMLSTTTHQGDTIAANILVPNDTYRCTLIASDGFDTTTSTSQETMVSACHVEYTYDISVDFSDLEDVQNCWTASRFVGQFDPTASVETPLLNVYQGGESNGPMTMPSNTVMLSNYGVAAALTYNDGPPVTWYYGNSGSTTLQPELNVHPAVSLQWTSPIDTDCTLDINLTGIGSAFTNPAFTQTFAVYHEENEISSFDVSGAISTVNDTLSLQAGDRIRFIFDTAGRTNYDFSGISTNGSAFVQFDGTISCNYP